MATTTDSLLVDYQPLVLFMVWRTGLSNHSYLDDC